MTIEYYETTYEVFAVIDGQCWLIANGDYLDGPLGTRLPERAQPFQPSAEEEKIHRNALREGGVIG